MSPTAPLEVVQRGSSTSLIDLPSELLTAICAFVACPTVVWCRLVCRRLRDVIDASLEMQYRIELVRDGMIDGGACSHTQWHSQTPNSAFTRTHAQMQMETEETLTRAPLTTSDRLARLRELRKAWTTLSWTRCVTVPMPGPCCAYELVGGVFCKTQPTVRQGRGRGREQAGGEAGSGSRFGNASSEWLGAANGHGYGDGDGFENGHGDGGGHGEEGEGEGTHVLESRTMSLTWLPGTHYLGRTDVRDDLGIPTRDLAMDPSQDLMVLFKGGEDAGLPMVDEIPGMLELHIRTMSTDQTHPEARVPVLCVPMLYPITNISVQIADDVVGMMYCVGVARPRITIWNWKTGRLVVERASGSLPPDAWDFSFIHSRALFVTTRDGSGTLELYTFTCGRAGYTTDANADSDSSPPSQLQPEPTPITHVATLHLPLVRDSVFLLRVDTHTGPFLATCPPDTPFVSSNEGRIHVVTVQYADLPMLDGPRTHPKVCVFVHGRTLERYLEMGAAQRGLASAAVGAIQVPWSEWGQTDARMLPHLGAFQWLRYVHGQRVVMLLPTSNIDGLPHRRLGRFGQQTTSKRGKSTFQVLDFNVRRAFNDDDGDPSQVKTTTTLERVDYPTHLVMPSIFVDVVESGLPYREVRREVRGGYSGAMIDDERLVGLKHPASPTEDMKEIDVFTM